MTALENDRISGVFRSKKRISKRKWAVVLRKIIILRKKIYAYGANNPVRYIAPGGKKDEK